MAKPSDLFFDRARVETIPTKRVRWGTSYRLHSTKYPPVPYWEGIADAEDAKVLDDLEKLTDPTARQAVGRISLVPASRRIFGPGASFVMGPFVHASKDYPSRFTDGSFGIYYAGRQFETALREVAYHRALFHAATSDPPGARTSFATIAAKIDKKLHDLRTGAWSALLDPDPSKYGLPQTYGSFLKEAGSNGIVYPSVRHDKGECIAAFWPNIMANPKEIGRITLKWDGSKIGEWFDFKTEEWASL